MSEQKTEHRTLDQALEQFANGTFDDGFYYDLPTDQIVATITDLCNQILQLTDGFNSPKDGGWQSQLFGFNKMATYTLASIEMSWSLGADVVGDLETVKFIKSLQLIVDFLTTVLDENYRNP